VDRRSGLEGFTDSEIREREQATHDFQEAQDLEAIWPMVKARGHIKEGEYHGQIALFDNTGIPTEDEHLQ